MIVFESRSLPPLYILRHGETEWNRQGRMQGRLDSPLTDLGRAQAARQGAILRRVLPADAVARTSPSGRAVQTADIALEGNALQREIDDRLPEVDVGSWQGRFIAEIAPEHPGIVMEGIGWQLHAPGGERMPDLAARCAAVLSELDAPTVLVTHGITSRALRCLALGLPLDDLGNLPGGQGNVHVVHRGTAQLLED